MKKTICITGATSGIGKACAERFAEDGSKLILIGRRTDRLKDLTEELSSRCAIHPLVLDVRDAQSVASLVESLPKEFQAIDLLINNAGLALGLSSAEEANLEDWQTMIDNNTTALVRMTAAVLPGMVDRKRGHIINIGSVAGSYPYPGGNVYGATKAFVKQFSQNLRCDLQGKNIRVTNIEPGMTETEFSEVRYKGDKARADKVYSGAKPLTGADIAEACYWAASVPDHVNVNSIEVMPTTQAWSGFAVYRDPTAL